MPTKKECVYRAARQDHIHNAAQAIADRAEAIDYEGYDDMITDGKALIEEEEEE